MYTVWSFVEIAVEERNVKWLEKFELLITEDDDHSRVRIVCCYGASGRALNGGQLRDETSMDDQ